MVDSRGERRKRMLYGRFEHTIDAKNRMFIPAKYKETLESSFKLTFNGLEKCIMVYSNREWEKYEESLTTLPPLQFADYIREVYSNTVDVQIDSQGRVVIPQFLKEQVEIEKNVIIVGVGNHIEIWSKDVFEAKRKNINMDEIKRAMIGMGL